MEANDSLVHGLPGQRGASALRGFLAQMVTGKGVLTFIDQAVFSGTTFLTTAIIGRVCTKEQLGLFTLGFTLVYFAANFQAALILTPYTIYSPRLRGETQARYLGSTLLHQFAFSLLLALVLILAWIAAASAGYLEILPILQALVVAGAFILFREYARQVCFASLDMGTALVLDLSVSALQLSALLVLAHWGWLSATFAYGVIGGACGLVTLHWLWWMKKAFAFSLTQAAKDFLHNWGTGSWILASGLLWSLNSYIYPWLLAIFHGTASTGVWAACLGIVASFNPVYLSLQNYLSPKMAHVFAREGTPALRRFSFRATAFLALLLAPFCLLLLGFGDLLVTKIYGGKYAGSGPVIALLGLNLLVVALSFPFSRALFIKNRAKLDFQVNAASLLVLFSLGLWLSRALGPLGAALGLLLGNLGGLILRYLAFSRGLSDHEGKLA